MASVLNFLSNKPDATQKQEVGIGGFTTWVRVRDSYKLESEAPTSPVSDSADAGGTNEADPPSPSPPEAGTLEEERSTPGKGMMITGIVLTALGAIAVVPGIVFIVIGSADTSEPAYYDDDTGYYYRDAGDWPGDLYFGATFLAVGGTLLATGIPLWVIGHRRMKRAGERAVALHYPAVALDPKRSTVGLSLSLTF